VAALFYRIIFMEGSKAGKSRLTMSPLILRKILFQLAGTTPTKKQAEAIAVKRMRNRNL
jgi:hypothetical protein